MRRQAMVTQNGADFELVYTCDTLILIVDMDQGGRSVTNDAYNVVRRLNKHTPCTVNQQKHLQRLACGQETKKKQRNQKSRNSV